MTSRRSELRAGHYATDISHPFRCSSPIPDVSHPFGCRCPGESLVRGIPPLRPLHLPGLPPHRRLREAAPLLEHPVVSAVPNLGDRREPALLTHRLEAQPPIGELCRNGGPGIPPTIATVLSAPALAAVGAILIEYPALAETTLGRRWMDLPHIPDSSLLILERPVGHRFLRARKLAEALRFSCHQCGRPRLRRGPHGS